MPNSSPTVFTPIADQVANEDVLFGMNIKNNFRDVDGDTLTFTLDPATPLPNGLTLNSATGVIDGIPTNPAVPDYTITVIASDGNGGSVTDTFVITVNNSNDAPTVTTPIPNSVATEDIAYTLNTKPNFSDIDAGDTLTFSATGLPDGLTISASTGVISGTATNAAVGTKNVTVTANDGKGGTVSSTFMLTVENTNDAPTVTTPIADRSINEDTFFSTNIRSNFADIDVGNSLTFTATGLPTGLSIASNGVISGTPTNAAVGNNTIIITANDGNGGTVSNTFILTVTNTNDTPVVVNLIPDTTATEDNSFSLNITSYFSDIDAGDTLTYTAIGLPDGLSINPMSGIISGSPTNNAVGSRNITVTANDGKGGNVSDTFTLTVLNTNDAPTVSTPIPDRTATEDALFSMNIRGNFADVDGGDTLTFGATGLPTGLTLNPTTGVLNGVPTNSNVGANTITITANDGNGGTVSDTFVLTVINTNDAPTIAEPIPDQTATEDSFFTVSTSSSFTDVDAGDTLTFSAASLPAGLVIDPVTGVISGTPTNDAVGVKNITVTANDNKGGTVSDTFAIAIANTNDVPTVVTPIANQSATEDVFFSMSIKTNFTDVDTVDTLNYFASGLPVGLSIDASTGVISGIATNAAVGANSITITASDGNGGTVNSTFTLTVANTNDAPTLTEPLPPQAAIEDSPFTLNISGNFADPDNGDTLTFSATALPDGLTFDNATGTISGSPTNAAVGTKNVTVTANDGKGGTVNGTFALTVIDTNDDPNVKMAIGDKTVIEDTPFSLNISGNFADIDLGDSLAFSAAGLPEGVEIDPTTGVISGAATNDGVGTRSITVVADDGDGGTASDIFTLTITNTNDAPTVVNPIPDRPATEETDFIFDISGNFTDVDTGDTLSYTAQGLPDGLSINTITGIISGTLTNAAVGAKDVTITATDSNGGKATDIFAINTANTNDDPIVSTPIADRTITQNVPLSLNLSSNFADIDLGDSLTYEVTGLPTGLILNGTTGILSGIPTEIGTSANIIVTANDGNGGIVSDAFDLVVTANTAPTVTSAIADQMINANSDFNFALAANTFSSVDPGDSLTFTAQLDSGGALPTWLSFNATTQTFSGKPTNAQAGAINVKVTATDGAGVAVSDVFNLKVNAVVTPVPSGTPGTPVISGTPTTPGISVTPIKGVGDDLTIRGTEGRDRLIGTSKNETLIGGSSNDILKGGGGNDKLFGGKGNDKLFGGKGKDIFVLEKGKGFDIIQDFKNGLDFLAVPGMKLNKLGISQKGRNTVVSFGKDELAVLVGVQSDQITPKDFTKV
ncbi:MAG: putative Ig domain-containing protein [Timaviella obliquedivisa GSE-PSE-MK23-08B]|jgi:Ca2+-binding RTX toxin-like protein|nr:putative Ig domain-containing protein [Timaviella obliquedivisa GSE-PSE-MK23-08B]